MATKRTPEYEAALVVANQARVLLGLPVVDSLYPGTPKDPYACAITETVYDDDLERSNYIVETTMFGLCVYKGAKRVQSHGSPYGTVVVKDDKPPYLFRKRPDPVVEVPIPPAAWSFMKRFDRKLYRTLIKKKE